MNSSLLKIGAVVSALVLGGVYVVIQQRSAAKPGGVEDPTTAPADDEVTLMVGPKSAGGDLGIPLMFDEGAEDAPPVLMPSSKTIVMPVFQDAEIEVEAVELPEAIMSSSKSGAIQLDPEELKNLLEQVQDSSDSSESKGEADEQP